MVVKHECITKEVIKKQTIQLRLVNENKKNLHILCDINIHNFLNVAV